MTALVLLLSIVALFLRHWRVPPADPHPLRVAEGDGGHADGITRTADPHAGALLVVSLHVPSTAADDEAAMGPHERRGKGGNHHMDPATALWLLKAAGIVLACVAAYMALGIILHRVIGWEMKLNPHWRANDDPFMLAGLFRWAASVDAGLHCRVCKASIAAS